jgi:hypothetical protein
MVLWVVYSVPRYPNCVSVSCISAWQPAASASRPSLRWGTEHGQREGQHRRRIAGLSQAPLPPAIWLHTHQFHPLPSSQMSKPMFWHCLTNFSSFNSN